MIFRSYAVTVGLVFADGGFLDAQWTVRARDVGTATKRAYRYGVALAEELRLPGRGRLLRASFQAQPAERHAEAGYHARSAVTKG